MNKKVDEKVALSLIAGASSGGSGPRTPVEDPDNLQSSANVSIIDLIGEGQIGGLVTTISKENSILLNGTPMRHKNGDKNFENVAWLERTGQQIQDYIEGFGEGVETPFSKGVQLKAGEPSSFKISSPNTDRVRILIAVNALTNTNTKNGDISGTSVSISFRISLNGRGYKEIATKKITGKTTSRYQRSFVFDLPKAMEDGTPVTSWDFQVIRLTPDSQKSEIQNTTYFDSYSEVALTKFTYPNSALIATRFNAEAFSSIPKREYLVDGLLIKVPSNYDHQQRTYSGVWDGTFKLAASDNPAWILYDLLLNERYGLGRHISVEMIDEARLYQIGQYCDQLVDDGFGKKEPRYTINCVLNNRVAAYDLIVDICSTFNGMAYWAGDMVGFTIDAPSDPVLLVNNTNIVGDFSYSGTSVKDRHSIAVVTWNDPEDDYKQVPEPVEDHDLIARYGIRKTEIMAFGCTSRGQAARMGRWMLYSEHQQSEMIAFKLGLDSSYLLPGDLIQIQDRDRAGKRLGGRLLSCTATSAILDDKIEFEALENLEIDLRLEDGSIVSRPITSHYSTTSPGSNNTKTVTVVTWAQPLKELPVKLGVWIISSPNLEPVLARVVNIAQGDQKGTFDITAIPHNPSKYLSIENDLMLEVPKTTILDSRNQAAPKNVYVKSEIITSQGIAKTRVIIGWDDAKNASQYEVEWKRNDSNWVKLPRTSGLSIEIEDAFAGIYTARVTAFNIFGAKSYPKYSNSVDVQGKTGKPQNAVGFTVIPLLFGMKLDWVYPNNSADTSHAVIEVSDYANGSKPRLVGSFAYPANTHSIQGLHGNLDQYYRIKTVDKTGNESDWSDFVKGTTSADPEEILKIIEGEIGSGVFDPETKEKLEKIEENSKAIIKEINDRAAADLEESKARITAITKEANDRTFAIATEATNRANAITSAVTKEVNDRNAAIAVESKNRVDAINKEVSDRNAAIAVEATNRANAIAAKAAEINTSINTVTNSINKEVQDRKDALKLETDTRVLALSKLNDGLTTEITQRKSEDASLLSNIETFKTSTNNTLTSVQQQVTTNATNISSQASKTTALDGRLTAAEGALTKKLDATVIDKYSTTVETNKAIADRITEYNAGLTIGGKNFWWFANGGSPDYGTRTVEMLTADNQHQRVTITGTKSGFFSNLWQSLRIVNGGPIGIDEPASVSFYILSPYEDIIVYAYIWGQANNVVSKPVKVTPNKWTRVVIENVVPRYVSETNPAPAYGGLLGIRYHAPTIGIPEADLIGKVFEIKDIQCQSGTKATAYEKPQAITDNAINANASAIQITQSKVEDIDGRVTSNSSSITSLKNEVTAVKGEVSKKADSSALSALKTTVEQQGDTLTSQGTSITNLTNSLSTTNSNVSAAQSAAQGALDAANAKGKVIYGATAPTLADRLSQNLWIDTTNNTNTPKRWNGSAWIVVTDKVATDAAAAAANALSQVATKADASAVTALDNKVTNIDGKVSTNSSAITSLTGRVNTVENGLSTKADSAVLVNYATKTEMNNTVASGIQQYDASLVIGGANLQDNSHFDNPNKANGWGAVYGNQRIENSTYIKTTTSVVGANRIEKRINNVEVGKTYTITLYAKSSVLLNITNEQTANANVTNVIRPAAASMDKFQKYHATFTVVALPVTFRAYTPNVPIGDQVILEWEKLEEGTKASDWTPSNVDITSKIDANAQAITTIQSQVTNLDGKVTSNSQAITTLTNEISSVKSNVATKADASALNALQSTVTQQGGTIASQGSSITDLKNRVSTTEKDLTTKANSSTVTALDSKVTQQGNTISSQGSAITKLQNDLATTNSVVDTKASTSALTALDSKVSNIDGKVTSQGTQLVDLKNDLETTTNTANGALQQIIPTTQKNGKLFRSVLNVDLGGVSSSDNIVIQTPITFTAKMFKIIGSGFTYKTGTNDISFNVGGYAYSGNSLLITSATNNGTARLRIRMGIRNSRVVVILNVATDTGVGTWSYPKINLDAEIGYTNPPDSWKNDWTAQYVAESDLADFGVTNIATPPTTDVVTTIKATSSALQTLDSKVTEIDGKVTSQQTALTSLQGRVTKAEGTLLEKADSSALASLDSKVTTIGQKVDSNSADIVTLKNSVTSINGELGKKADATAVTSLTNRVAKNENDIASQSDQLVSLNNSVTTSVTVTSINSVTGFNKSTLAPGEDSLAVDANAYGGKVIKLGDNAGNDTVWLDGKAYIPIDPNRMYRVKARYRRVTGTGVVYIGLACKDTDGRFINVNGAVTSSLSASSYLIQHRPNLGEWQEAEWFIKGRGTSASGAGTLADPRKFQPNAVSFAPMAIANYNAVAGEVEIDYISIEYADEYPLIDANAQATQTLSSKVETIDGKVTSNSSAITQLNNKLSTVEGTVSTKADAKALQSLDQRVTAAEGNITTQSTAITQLNNKLDMVDATNLVVSNKDTEGKGAIYRLVAIPAKPDTALKAGERITVRGMLSFSHPNALTVNQGVRIYLDGNPAFPTIYKQGDNQIFEEVVTVPSDRTFLNLSFFFVPNGVAVAATSLKVHWAEVVRGDIKADASAVNLLDTKVTNIDGRVTTNSTAITSLNNRLTTAEGKITANTNALSSLTTKVTDIDGVVTAQGNSVTQLGSRLDANAGPGMAQDFLCVDAYSWFDHYKLTDSVNLSPYFNNPIPDGPMGDRGYYAGVGSSPRFVYNKTPLPTAKRYRVQFWAKRTAEATGACYITILRTKAGEKPNVSNYTYVGISNAELPADNTWNYIDKIINLTSSAATFPRVYLGFSINNGVTAGESWVQGFKITELIDTADAPNLATADAVNSLTTRVSNAEGKLDSQASQITSINTSLSGKADNSAVTSLTSRMTAAEGSITGLNNLTTNLSSRMTTAEGKITANSNALNTLDTKVTEVDGKVTNQASALTSLTSKFEGQVVGGTNLQPGTQSAANWTQYNTYGTVSKVTGGFKTDLIRVTKVSANAGGAVPIAAMRKITARKGTPIIMTFKVRGNVKPEYIYLMASTSTGSNAPANSVSYSSPISEVDFVTCTATWNATNFSYQTAAYPLIAENVGGAGRWFEFAEVMIQEGNTATVWSPSYLDEIDTTQFASATAHNALETKVTNIDGRVTSQASLITNLQSQMGNKADASILTNYYTKTQADSAIASASTTLKSEVKADYQSQLDNLKLDRVSIPDTRTVDQSPDWYWKNYPRSVVTEFKSRTAVGNPGGAAPYGSVETIVPWSDASGGVIIQKWSTAGEENTRFRQSMGTGTSATWSAWGSELERAKVQISEQTQVIDGIKAVKSVTVDNNGMVSGWGLVSELKDGKVNSTIGFKADQIYFESPNDGRKPFVVLTEPREINGTLYPAGTWIDAAYIAQSTIKLAHIDTASIGSLSAISANLGTMTTLKDPAKPFGARMVMTGSLITVFDDNNVVRVKLGLW